MTAGKRELHRHERLFNEIFKRNEYNKLVRPMNQYQLTHVEIELKLLQIDLVIEIILVLFDVCSQRN